jgi:hypothetical protein
VRGLWQSRLAQLAPAEAEQERRETIAIEAMDGRADLYIIQSAAGPIKIGISVNPRGRLKGLQTAHPWKLSLLCVIPGGCALEAQYHARFAEHRLHGEWFSPHPDILAEIDRLNSPVFP